jgi:hypothetical protein
MKVRTLTVLLPSFKPLKNHVIRTFLQLCRLESSLENSCQPSDMLPRSSRINVPLLNRALGMMWLCVSMSAMAYGVSIAFHW